MIAQQAASTSSMSQLLANIKDAVSGISAGNVGTICIPAYLDAKTDDGRIKRLEWMMERLENNLKPM